MFSYIARSIILFQYLLSFDKNKSDMKQYPKFFLNLEQIGLKHFLKVHRGILRNWIAWFSSAFVNWSCGPNIPFVMLSRDIWIRHAIRVTPDSLGYPHYHPSLPVPALLLTNVRPILHHPQCSCSPSVHHGGREEEKLELFRYRRR